MLDSNKENLKLDAMKRIVGMIAKGKNASDLFPAVVKNVVSKNVEVIILCGFRNLERRLDVRLSLKILLGFFFK